MGEASPRVTIAVGDRYDAAFGRYKVHRIDGDTIVMIDVDRPTAMVMPTRDKLGPGLNFWPVVASPSGGAAAPARPGGDAGEPAAPAAPSSAKPRAAPAPAPAKTFMTEIVGVKFHPRPTAEEACPFLARLGRYRCGFTACPPACPRSGVAVEVTAPLRNPDPPPLTALELDEIWSRVGGSSPRASASPSTTPALEGGLLSAPAAASSPPASEPAPPALEPAADRAVDAPSAPPDAGGPAEPSIEPPRPSSSTYPPCLSCGQVRTIMLVLAPSDGKEGQGYATLCSRCAQGHRNDQKSEDEAARHRFRRFFGREG